MNINATMIVLPMKDISQTIEYYHKNFQFQVTEIWPKEDPNYVLLSNDNNHLGFLQSEKEIESNKETSINFDVDDIDDIYANIKDNVEIVEELAEAEYSRKEFSLLDCNGYKIIIGQYSRQEQTEK